MKYTYLIILKLAAQEDLYKNLVVFLKTADAWARPMPSVWIIKASKGSAEIRDGIKSRIGTNDSVLVVEISQKGWATSNLTKVVTDWMKNNI